MNQISLIDVSEFQTNIDAPQYLHYHKSIVCRVHNGYRPDLMMPGRLHYLRQYPFAALGLYQYLARDVDPAQQAREFIAQIGHLHANEFPILDLEEGHGLQVARAQEWFTVVDQWAGFQATLYSYLSFFQTNLGGGGNWGSRPLWVADFDVPEPSIPHVFWQNTKNLHHDAVTPPYCDSSIYHGTDEEFIKAVRQTARA